MLIVPEGGGQAGEVLGWRTLKALLVHVEETVLGPPLHLARARGIPAPLLEPGHFLRQVNLLAAFGFDDPDRAIAGLHQEIRDIAREIPVGLNVVDLEADREVVLGESDDIRRCVEKAREAELEASGMWFAHDLAEQ